jgi:hypothetical protein
MGDIIPVYTPYSARFLTDSTETSVAGINLQGYNGFLHNMKQLRWRV